MNEIIKFLVKNLIAIISLIISLYILWKNRKFIDVTWGETIQKNEIGFVLGYDSQGKPMQYGLTCTANLSIVNPSPNDIGYFDLRVFDPKTNINIDFLTKNAVAEIIHEQSIYTLIDSNPPRTMKMDIPKRMFGMLPANSFTRFDIIVVLDYLPNEIQNFDTIAISFKIPKKAGVFHKDRFAITNRRKYKFYQYAYDITGWKEPLKQKTKEQSTESVNLEKTTP